MFYRNLVVKEDEFWKIFFGQSEFLHRDVVVGKLDERNVGLLQFVVDDL